MPVKKFPTDKPATKTRLIDPGQKQLAELQIINSVQQGVSSNLDFQSIIDMLGDKLREIFVTGDMSIT